MGLECGSGNTWACGGRKWSLLQGQGAVVALEHRFGAGEAQVSWRVARKRGSAWERAVGQWALGARTSRTCWGL